MFRIAIQNVIGIVIWTTCVHMHCKRLANHDRDLRTARSYFAPTAQSARADWPIRLCMTSARIFKMHTHESRSERALRSHVLESDFLGGSRSKTPFFRVSKAWFETALRSHGLKSGFQIRKGPNHVLKRLSECNSSPCEYSLRCARSTFAPIPRMRCPFNRWQPHLHTLPIHGQFSVAFHWLSWPLVRIFSHNSLTYECGEMPTIILISNSTYLLQEPMFCDYFSTTGKLRFSPFMSVFFLFGKLSFSKLFTYEVENCYAASFSHAHNMYLVCTRRNIATIPAAQLAIIC